MKKVGMIFICAILISCITVIPIFATNYDLSDTVTISSTIPLNTSQPVVNDIIMNCVLSSNKLHVIDYDIEYTTSGAPTYTFTPSVSSVSGSITNSTGGSISMNAPTSTGSQSGRYTIPVFSTTTNTYGFTASPSGSQTLTTHESYIYQLDFTVYLSMTNPNGYTVRPENGSEFRVYPNFNTINSHYLGCSVDVLDSNGLTFKGFNNTDSFLFTFDSQHSYAAASNGTVYGLIDNYETVSCLVKVSLFFFSTSTLSNITVSTINTAGITAFTQPAMNLHPNQTIQQNLLLSSVDGISNKLQTIVDSYNNNSSNISDTQDNIDAVGSEESQLHQAEINYYLQNEQALQNVGISNFSFSSDQSSGLGAVVTDFTDLWNNLGPLQIIFTFTLSMSLATYLLRHRPITGAIKQNERKK